MKWNKIVESTGLAILKFGTTFKWYFRQDRTFSTLFVVLCFKLLCRSQSSQTLTAYFFWTEKKKLTHRISPCYLWTDLFSFSLYFQRSFFYVLFVTKKGSFYCGESITLQKDITNFGDYLIAKDFLSSHKGLWLCMHFGEYLRFCFLWYWGMMKIWISGSVLSAFQGPNTSQSLTMMIKRSQRMTHR